MVLTNLLNIINYLNININLRLWIQLRQNDCIKCLFQMCSHLQGLSVSPGPPLAVLCAECCHAVLAIDQDFIMPGFAFASSYLYQVLESVICNAHSVEGRKQRGEGGREKKRKEENGISKKTNMIKWLL